MQQETTPHKTIGSKLRRPENRIQKTSGTSQLRGLYPAATIFLITEKMYSLECSPFATSKRPRLTNSRIQTGIIETGDHLTQRKREIQVSKV
jgi:hypothetical protein